MDQVANQPDDEMAAEDDDDSVHYEDVVEEDSDLEEEENEEDDGDEGEEAEDEEEYTGPTETYLPGKPLAEGEELVCDENAYVMFHQANTGKQRVLFNN